MPEVTARASEKSGALCLLVGGRINGLRFERVQRDRPNRGFHVPARDQFSDVHPHGGHLGGGSGLLAQPKHVAPVF